MKINKKITILLIIFLAFVLRIYKAASIPSGLYWDEAAMALDAKSVAQTGKDQHGHFWLQPIYPSWGDYKLPGYIVAAVPFFWLIADSPELAIRLPSVVAGTLTVLVIYFLAKELFKDKKLKIGNWQLAIGLIAGLLLAISPWHLQFSRAAFEANLALFFNSLAIYSFLKAGKKKSWLMPALVFSLLGVYTYYSARIVLPIILFLTFILFFPKNLKNILYLLVFGILMIVSVLPLKHHQLAAQAEQFRLSTKNILNDPQIINYSSSLIEQDGQTWWSRKVHHRFFYQAKVLADHYADHFSFHYLLLNADPNLRHSTGKVGVIFLVGFLGLVLGEYYLFDQDKKIFVFLNLCLLISFLPACVPYETPHSLRSLNGVIFINLISAYGLAVLVKKLLVQKHFIWFAIFSCLLFGQLLFYLHDYYAHYPHRSFFAWQGGYKEAIRVVNENFDQADQIIFTTVYARPYLYFLLYSDYPLVKFQEQRAKLLQKEPLNYQETFKIDKITFSLLSPEDLAVDQLEKILILASPEELNSTATKQLNSAFSVWQNY